MTSIMQAPSALDRRRRVIDAMGLGPLWLRRSRAPVEDRPVPDEAEPARAARIAAMDFDVLVEAVATCRACALCETRTRAVFGEGSRQPDWLVVGAAPSENDDGAGTPLTGQPGRLLDAMLASIGLARERNVFVTTAVKCRPPGDRDPSPLEVEACRPYLARQFALLTPRRLLEIGGFGASASGAVATRGTVHAVAIGEHSVPALATHHPQRLLAEPHLKAEAWADLCAARSS